MVHRWDRLAFVHVPFDPPAIRPLLPPGLDLDTHDGVAWIGLIPFSLTVSPAVLPALPWASRFPETNVRTYVRGPEGGRGIWFFSLDAARLGAVLGARTWYHLPYMWSRMRLSGDGSMVRYESRRRWPGPRGVRFLLQIALQDPVRPDQMSSLERFLICRWRLYAPALGGLHVTLVEHPPWPLFRAMPLAFEEGLLAAVGLSSPGSPPLVHFSPGVEARFGPRRRLQYDVLAWRASGRRPV